MTSLFVAIQDYHPCLVLTFNAVLGDHNRMRLHLVSYDWHRLCRALPGRRKSNSSLEERWNAAVVELWLHDDHCRLQTTPNTYLIHRFKHYGVTIAGKKGALNEEPWSS